MSNYFLSKFAGQPGTKIYFLFGVNKSSRLSTDTIRLDSAGGPSMTKVDFDFFGILTEKDPIPTTIFDGAVSGYFIAALASDNFVLNFQDNVIVHGSGSSVLAPVMLNSPAEAASAMREWRKISTDAAPKSNPFSISNPPPPRSLPTWVWLAVAAGIGLLLLIIAIVALSTSKTGNEPRSAQFPVANQQPTLYVGSTNFQ
jgi:hypothetical protein